MADNGRLGKLHAVEIASWHIGEQNHKGRARANYQRIHKHAQHLDHALRNRVLDFGGSRNIWGGALPGLVGIQAAFDADHHGLGNERAEQATACRIKAKGVLKNQRKHAGNFADIDHHDQQGDKQINHGHGRHQHFGHARYAAHAAKNNGRAHNHQGNAYGMLVPAPGGLGGGHNRVGLHGVVYQPEAEDQAQGKQNAQPPLPKALGDVIGWAAPKRVAVVPADFEQLRQRRFGKGRTHADQCRHPHPEYGAGAACGYGNGHTGDIAYAHTAGQAGNKGLKRRNTVRIATSPAAPQHLSHTAPKQAKLHKSGCQGKKQAGTQKQINQPLPQGIANVFDVCVQGFGHENPWLFH